MDTITSVITQSAAQDLRAARDRVIKADDRHKQAKIMTTAALLAIPAAPLAVSAVGATLGVVVVMIFVTFVLTTLGIVLTFTTSRASKAAREQLPEIWDEKTIEFVERVVMGPMSDVVRQAENKTKAFYREPVFVPVYEPAVSSTRDYASLVYKPAVSSKRTTPR